MGFVNLHTHSHFSRTDAIAKPKDIVSKVKSMGQNAVAITDHGTTSGLIETYKECKSQGIKMIFGCEHYLAHNALIKDNSYRHIMFWAKDKVGYNNLLKLTTLAHENFYRKPRLDLGIIKKHSEGLIVSSACIGGWLRKIVDGENVIDIDTLEQMLDIFKDNLYIELHTYSVDEQKEWNLKLVEVAKQYNVPLIAACDAHYINKEDAYVHKMWLTQGKEREDGYYQIPDFYLHDIEEIREKLSYLPKGIVEQAIENTQVLADKCNVEIKFGEQHYPTVDVVDKKEAILNIMRKNWKSKLPDKLEWQKHKERIEHEMPVLENADYFSYFLIMEDFIKDCKKEGIPISPSSRGSAGGCDVAYLMDIHNTNPIKYDLMFARFLHEERVTPCDIDLDLSKKRRGDAIEIIKKKYGYDRVFQARTYGYMAAKGALKRAGNSLGYDPQYINELSKGMPKFSDDEEEFKGVEKEWHLLDLISKPEIEDLITLAKSFVGVLQSFGIHASAIIVFPDAPDNYTAIEKSGDNFITAYEFHTLEDLGILKLDILGIKTIDVIYDTLNLIEESVDIKNLPPDDKKTFDMLCDSLTAGVFQLEGNGFTQLVKKIQPKHFEDLAPLLAIYRPAIISAGLLDTYIKRKTGEETIEYLHEDLEPLLNKTYGLAVYQENIIEISKTICGYTPGQADLIRRACGRKKPEEMAKIKPDFIQKAVNNGYTEGFATKLFELIEFFAGYGFGKAHTYGYGEMSYITAYLKANYPKEFMVSLINSEEKQEDILPYIQECKRLNIPILPPDVSLSQKQWTIEGDSLRIGLTYIKGIGDNIDLSDISSFNSITKNNNKRIMEALVKAGALDTFGERRDLLKEVYKVEHWKQVYEQKIKQSEDRTVIYQDDLQKTKDTTKKYQEILLKIANRIKDIEKYQKKVAEVEIDEKGLRKFDEVAGECHVLGFSFQQIPKLKQGTCTNIFTKLDKNKKEMSWITLESPYGEFRCTCFWKMWKELKPIVKQGDSYWFIVDEKGILVDLKEVG